MKKNKTIAILIVFLLLVCFPEEVFSQGYKAKNMKVLLSDISASTKVRYDSLGVPCGLVKVLVKNSQMNFSGDIVGGIENKMNEYWVYLSKGAKNMYIKPNDALPFRIDFGNYGIKEIESKVTYQLLLDYKPYNEKNAVVINVVPRHAVLTIDNCALDKRLDGSYRLYLAKGEHICRIDAQGFRPAVEIVTSGKGLQTANVSLESLMASVKIKSNTVGALLFVDGKQVGISEWEGHLAAGKYTVEAKKEGFSSVQQDVVVVEKGMHYIEIPSLHQLLGTIRLVSDISEFTKILLDGDVVVMKDNLIQNVKSGKHFMSFYKYGYEKKNIPIIVRGALEDTIHCVLTPRFRDALQGDGVSQKWAADITEKDGDYDQAEYWYKQAIEHLDGTSKAEVMNSLAFFYKHKCLNLAKAEETYLRLIEYELSRKTNSSLLYNSYHSLADINKEEGRYKEAIKWYIKADNEFSLIDIGDCYMKIGEADKAKLYYKKAMTCKREHIRKEAKLKLETIR